MQNAYRPVVIIQHVVMNRKCTGVVQVNYLHHSGHPLYHVGYMT